MEPQNLLPHKGAFKVSDDIVPLAVIDLFAGAGGISEGFRQAGYRILGGVDIDPDAAATYALNFPEAKTILGDIRQPHVHRATVDLARQADVLVGGPPCQAFSQVRNHVRLIDDSRNSLYREFVSVLQAILPSAFLLENVTGIDQMGVRERITDDLTLEGEYIVQPQVLDAADFGVPQTRKRLLFIGVRRSLGIAPPIVQGSGATDAIILTRFASELTNRYVVVAQEGLCSKGLFTALNDPDNPTVVPVIDAISDLAPLAVGNRDDQLPYALLLPAQTAYQRLMRERAGDVLSNVQVPRVNADTVMRLQGIPQGGNYRDLPEKLLDRYITGQRWGQDNGSGKLSRRHFYAYRRLHPDIWAWTLNTKADAVYHYAVARSLSVREFARLQSFPDRFVFTADPRRGAIPGRIDGGPAHSRYRQVGNAVPVLLARAVAVALRDAISTAIAQEQQTA